MTDNFFTILHPMIVHFPVALIITTFFLYLLNIYRKKGVEPLFIIRLLIILAALGAWAAVVTGGMSFKLSGTAKVVEEMHHIWAMTTAFLISASAVICLLYQFIGNKMYKGMAWLAFILLCIATVTVGITGYYGGYIVYNILL